MELSVIFERACDLQFFAWKNAWKIILPSLNNYFYLLIGLSALVYALEILFPWRKSQPKIRKDFWLDAFYMFFNMFLFPLSGFIFLAQAAEALYLSLLPSFDLARADLILVDLSRLGNFWQLIVLFIVRDFAQWLVHNALHRSSWLWQFHKVHHSVEQMGFAAHLRYHWMENILYRSFEYFPLALFGTDALDFFNVYALTLLIGHLNHANIFLPLGPLIYIFNNPQMHIWHHARHLPESRQFGANFGLSLSLWDYVFGTAFIPESGRDIALGFAGVEKFPRSFWRQAFYPLIS